MQQNNISKAELLRRIDQRLELLALRLEVHGPEAATELAVRELSNGPVVLHVRNLLRSHGFTRREIADLMGERHPQGCACWACVISLHQAVHNHVAKLRSRRRRR